MPSNDKTTVDTIIVYADRRKSRIAVGTLTRTMAAGKTKYRFSYDERYLAFDGAIPVGPELPLREKPFESNTLFSSFADRLPQKENPAYADWCAAWGISTDENDQMRLLATLGSRGGSSSFFFEAVTNAVTFTGADLAEFRQRLGLSIREFSAVFDIGYATVQKVEKGLLSGTEVLKRMELYTRFPEAALLELERNRQRLHSATYERIAQKLSEISF